MIGSAKSAPETHLKINLFAPTSSHPLLYQQHRKYPMALSNSATTYPLSSHSSRPSSIYNVSSFSDISAERSLSLSTESSDSLHAIISRSRPPMQKNTSLRVFNQETLSNLSSEKSEHFESPISALPSSLGL